MFMQASGWEWPADVYQRHACMLLVVGVSHVLSELQLRVYFNLVLFILLNAALIWIMQQREDLFLQSN